MLMPLAVPPPPEVFLLTRLMLLALGDSVTCVTLCVGPVRSASIFCAEPAGSVLIASSSASAMLNSFTSARPPLAKPGGPNKGPMPGA